ncbi:hypothetical protein [Sandaracinus amylolyticus]|uniref:hypothetical protein n=1 Tax=Sandaracinus amylolyticus TaxID=927083 RepID=UPI0012ED056E|nr:hypothetical protein [Sandaracinus amylolyticus]
MRRALLCVAVLAVLGCDVVQPGTHRVVVRATRDGAPISGVAITEGGLLIGETGEDGALRLDAERPEGATLELVARCPDDLRARPDHLRGRVRAWSRRDAEGRVSTPPLEFEVRCERRVRDVVVVVDAGRPDLDVQVDGHVVARTDVAGLAHVAIEQPPGQRFVVRIDTSAHPDLAPPNPEQRFTVGAEDEVFYWSRPFEADREESVASAEPSRRRRGRRGGGGIERLR